STSPVKTITWTIANVDSVHTINKTFGSDTLRISFADTGEHAIHFKTIDNLGRTSEDSTFVIVVQDKPVITYISPSQTIGFGGMVQCSLAISHRFGACTLSVHLGNSLKDFKRSYTAPSIVYDTAFSTLQALTWDSVIIKVTDSHGNSVNTGFAITILQPMHDQWEDMTPMNDHHSCHASEVINDTLYVISGFKAKKPYGETPVTTVEAYDTSHKSWLNKSPLQYPRYNFMSCVFNDKICVLGGFNGNNYVPYMEQYDPQTNAWTVFDSMHVGKLTISRQASASCLAGSKLYVFGGTTISNDSSSDSVCQNIYMYDFSKNSWSESARKMLSPRSDFRAIQVGGKIYLIGGADANQQALSSIEVFDTVTQICSISPITLPIALSDFGAAMIGQKLYIIGGLTSNGEPVKSTYMMDFSLIPNTWSNKAALSSSRFYVGASALDGNIYISGGVTSFNDLLQFGATVDQDFIKYNP
ncbi:MAG: kelch repeat-containing protein, partial [Chitinivibrionales bacterium]